MINITNILSAKAQSRLSEDEAELVRAIISSVPDSFQKLETLDKMAQSLVNVDSIKKYSLLEYKIAKERCDTLFMMESSKRLGWYYSINNIADTSFFWYSIFHELSSFVGDEIREAKALSGIGDALLGMGDFELGIKIKNNALNILKNNRIYDEIGIIHRSIGKACSDYLQYDMALKNYKSALEIDKKMEPTLENTRNIGRDLHFIARTKFDQNTEIDEAMLDTAKEQLKQALKINIETQDHIYEIHTCLNLSMIYALKVQINNHWDYVDSSLFYYRQARQAAEISGYNKYKTNFDIVKAMHYTLMGNNVEALNILNQYTNFREIPNDSRINIFRGFLFYYYYNRDYRGILEVKELEKLSRHEIYITGFCHKISKINIESEYENIINDLNFETRQHQEDSKKQSSIYIKFYIICKIITILILLIIIILTIIYIHDLRINKKLKKQANELRQANQELTKLIDETREQSEEIKQQTKEMKRQRNKLSTFNFKMMIHLEIGRKIQRLVVPSLSKMRLMFPNIFIIWKPLEEVSGDFYWGTEIDGIKIVAVADCTGHGIPGAFLSMLGVAMLNSISGRVQRDKTTAADILNMLKISITTSLKRGSTNDEIIHDGMDIAICVFDFEAQQMSYAGSYRPLWLMRKGKLFEYKGDKIPVSVDNDKTGNFINHEIKILPNDQFYIFSDGITDQYGINQNGKPSKFKPKRFRELIEKICSDNPEIQQQKIENEIKKWKANQEQTDDILVMGIII